MNLQLTLYLSFLLLATVSCGIVKTENLEDDVRSRIIDDLRFATSTSERRDSLRLNGVYAISLQGQGGNSDSLVQPVQFLPNGLIIRDEGSYVNKQKYVSHWRELQERIHSEHPNADDIFCGFYYLKNGIVHAWIPLYYHRTRVSWSEVVLTHFEGEWIDENTIANWRLSEPFILPKDWPEEGEEHREPNPMYPTESRAYYNYQRWEELQTPVNLVFHSLPNPKTSHRYNFVKLSEYLNIEIIQPNASSDK
ncbi:hypothetical protein [Phaeocystidibacter marisrubri]|uniref:Uncharacterized protein n=1 Tax=Phaeocystidibacter marisrubri TaxID=1577780 RepID=A0A6L3ZDN7_9FLAO|nr:hypothetical protein [Phaeocystidibacter marisrubri]KAB2815554.1 hypothetical protein F8C82_07570 [Phaeocystidibacter marisrubri]GGH64500.1 hypothetical protein GCM10011318_00580 [Phaeocystidibacter marisrubri]